MPIHKNWSTWLLEFLGIAPAGPSEVEQVLRREYIWESQHSARYRQHAKRMQYRQFRDALLRIAADESTHLDWIAAMLRQIGSEPPAVPPIASSEKNSWQSLLDLLEEEQRHVAEMLGQAAMIRDEAPGAAELLERIYQEGKRHRDEVREMLMKIDPQANWLS